MFAEWSDYISGPLTARDFREVFTAPTLRDVSTWPDPSKPTIPEQLWAVDFGGVPLNELQRSIVAGVESPPMQTQGEAITCLRSLHGLAGQNPCPGRTPCG